GHSGTTRRAGPRGRADGHYIRDQERRRRRVRLGEHGLVRQRGHCGVRMTEAPLDGQIVVDDLTKVFRGKIRAVDRLSFTVEPGSVTGFLGPNGAGKTITLRMVLGLVHPTAAFRYQTITPTVLQTPSRWTVVAAKLLSYAIIGLAYALACLAVQLMIALP